MNKKITVIIDGTKLNKKHRREKAARIERDHDIIMNSNYYRKCIMNLDLRYKEAELSEWKNKDCAEIYDHIMSGWEYTNQIKDSVANIYIDDYYTFKRVIGYMKFGGKYIYVNTRYFDTFGDIDAGANVHHEAIGHQLGFKHTHNFYELRKYSLAYQLGLIYKACYIYLIKNRNKDISYLGEPPSISYIVENPTKKLVKKCSRSWRNLWLIENCYWIYV